MTATHAIRPHRVLPLLVALTLVAGAAGAFVVAAARAEGTPPLPVTPRRPVTDVYQGQSVVDDYRWLEDGHDPAVKAWSDSQNVVARDWLDHTPERKAILDRVAALNHSTAPRYSSLIVRGGLTFALKDDPAKQQDMIVALRSVDDPASERVIVDPNALDPTGQTTIDFFAPSLDGSKVAVSLSKGGTEDGTVHVYDVATGQPTGDVVPRVNGGTAGGSVTWNADGTGFWRTRYPAPGERPDADLPFYLQVWYHRLGTPESADTYVVGKEFPRIAEIELHTSPDGRWALADVFNGDGGEHAFWLAEGAGPFRQVTRFEDQCVKADFAGDKLVLLSHAGAPNGKLLALPLANARLAAARVLVPASAVAIQSFEPTAHRVYVEDMVGGPTQVRVFSAAGKPLGRIPTEPVSTVGGLASAGGDTLLLRTESYTRPARWWRFIPSTGKLVATALAEQSPATFAGVEVKRVFATSKDGTRVPMDLLMRKGTPLDGTAPTVLYGYGGYGISQTPSFGPSRQVWIEQGGIYAVACTRGGGEYGERWHRAGNLTNKQHVFDDFAACAQWLVEHHYTSPGRLAVRGGSNGGLTVGTMITQHPELVKSVVCQVGVLDALRSEFGPNGQFNVTEYGSVKDPAQFKALYAYSPYQHVQDGVKYPAVLFCTGANDPRVDPANSRKMAARMQAASTSGQPILLRTSATTGHVGSPLSARNEETADIFAFTFRTLGVTYKPVTTPLP